MIQFYSGKENMPSLLTIKWLLYILFMLTIFSPNLDYGDKLYLETTLRKKIQYDYTVYSI